MQAIIPTLLSLHKIYITMRSIFRIGCNHASLTGGGSVVNRGGIGLLVLGSLIWVVSLLARCLPTLFLSTSFLCNSTLHAQRCSATSGIGRDVTTAIPRVPVRNFTAPITALQRLPWYRLTALSLTRSITFICVIIDVQLIAARMTSYYRYLPPDIIDFS